VVLAGTFTVWLVVLKVGVLYSLVVAFVHSALTSPYFVVVWTRANHSPRNTIEQDQNIKMWAVGHKFEGGRFVTPHPLAPTI